MTSESNIIDKDNLAAPVASIQTIEITSVAESRRHSRVDESILAEVTTEKEESAIAMIVDISFSGLRLEVGSTAFETHFSGSDNEAKNIPRSVQVEFIIPGKSIHNASTRIRCNTVSLIETDDSLYQIGLEFVEIEKGATELAEYLISRGLI
jgi:PilZ domain